MKRILLISLGLSLLLNAALAYVLIANALVGCAEIQNGQLGVLKTDLPIGRLDGTDTIFTLPKGLVVRDASAWGVDYFEPSRFRLVVTSDRDDLVDYSAKLASPKDDEYYSADVVPRKAFAK